MLTARRQHQMPDMMKIATNIREIASSSSKYKEYIHGNFSLLSFTLAMFITHFSNGFPWRSQIAEIKFHLEFHNDYEI